MWTRILDENPQRTVRNQVAIGLSSWQVRGDHREERGEIVVSNPQQERNQVVEAKGEGIYRCNLNWWYLHVSLNNCDFI